MGERWVGRGSEEENQVAEKESFLMGLFGCVLINTHPRQTVPSEGSLTYRKASQVLKHLSLVSGLSLASALYIACICGQQSKAQGSTPFLSDWSSVS